MKEPGTGRRRPARAVQSRGEDWSRRRRGARCGHWGGPPSDTCPSRALSLQRRRPGQQFPGAGGLGAEGTCHVRHRVRLGSARLAAPEKPSLGRSAGGRSGASPACPQGSGEAALPCPLVHLPVRPQLWPSGLTHGVLYKLREAVSVPNGK